MQALKIHVANKIVYINLMFMQSTLLRRESVKEKKCEPVMSKYYFNF